MRWQLKVATQYLMAPVPLRLRRRLQDLRGSARFDAPVDYARKLQFLRRIMEGRHPIAGRDFLEMGTGWHPTLPLLLRVLGARRVAMSDLNPWLTVRSLRETVAGLGRLRSRIAEDLSLGDSGVASAFDEWDRVLMDPGTRLSDALAAMGMEYACPLDLRSTPFAADDFDYLVSSNVLEHVPEKVLRQITAESRRILRPGGFHLHHINPGDHLSYVDPAISSVNFLRYSGRRWRWIGGWGVGYHNRMRCVDFARLLEQEGLDVTFYHADPDPVALERLRSGDLRPHASFGGYTAEELAGYVVDVFARVPER